MERTDLNLHAEAIVILQSRASKDQEFGTKATLYFASGRY